jgi:PAS domain S-box-containing protein
MDTSSAASAEHWLAPVAQALEEMLWIWDPASGRITFTNEAFRRFWGGAAPEAGQRLDALLDRVHADDAERMRNALRQLPAQGYREEYRVLLPAQDGRRTRTAYLSEQAIPIALPGGQQRVTHVVRDFSWQYDTAARLHQEINRRADAERTLAESEAKYRKVVENVSEGILVTAAGRIVYANPKALAITGMDEQTALSQPFIEFIHPDDRDRVLGNHVRRLRGEAVESRYQFRVLHRSGDVRWVEISGVVFEWQNTPATLNFLIDVTQRRQAEEEVRAALARERELSELKSRFVAVASHEFRTPLAAILSSIELLDDYGGRLPEEERREVVGLIKGAVARMNGMVEQVLMTSRLEAGQFAFEPQPQAVPPLLVQLATELDQAHPQAGRIALRCEDGPAQRRIDARLLRHILTNLLGNALKYSPPDTPVHCTVRGDGDRLQLEVADRGIGIPAQDLPRLFERFHRGANVGNVQGTGMGLHIVKECVQLHGGRIDVESETGRGTTFRVQLLAPVAG